MTSHGAHGGSTDLPSSEEQPIAAEGAAPADPAGFQPPADPAPPEPAERAEGLVAEAGEASKASAAVPNQRRAVDEEADEQTAERERERRRSAQVLRDGAATTGDSSPAMTQIVTIQAGEETRIRKGALSLDWIQWIDASYVEVAPFRTLLRRMNSGRDRVTVICGDRGSGRLATATKLLVGRGLQIGMLDLGADVTVHEASKDERLISPGDGLILQIGEKPINEATLAVLRTYVGTESFLIIIADANNEDARAVGGVDHPRPDLDAALKKSLEAALERKFGPADQKTRDYVASGTLATAVIDWLQTARSVAEVAGLAQRLAEAFSTGESVEEIIAERPNNIRLVAQSVLRGADQGPGGSSEADEASARMVPYQQSYRIAYAAFNEHPLSDFFEAGAKLSENVLGRFESVHPLAPQIVFDPSMATKEEFLLHAEMLARGNSEETPRRVRLKHPQLLQQIIEVAWYEYDTFQAPLLDWLDELAIHRLTRVRVRAAQLAGLLTQFDFHAVNHGLISSWARRQVAYRVAAALALDFAHDHEPQLVQRQVRNWARSGNSLLQDTAARAYGTAVGDVDQAGAINALARLADNSDLYVSNAIATSMAQLFLAGNEDDVLLALGSWVTVDGVGRPEHAVRSLVLLANLAGEGLDGPVRLPDSAVVGEERVRAMAALWQRALTSPVTAGRAWKPVLRWLQSADRDPDRIDAFVELASAIFTGPLRDRALFNLARRRRQHRDSTTLRRVETVLRNSRGGK